MQNVCKSDVYNIFEIYVESINLKQNFFVIECVAWNSLNCKDVYNVRYLKSYEFLKLQVSSLAYNTNSAADIGDRMHPVWFSLSC